MLVASPTARWVNPLVTVLLVVVTWPVSSTLIRSDLDGSWQIALHLAVQRGLHFGTDIVFSYGPLGFLTVPWPWLGMTSLLAMVLWGSLHVALCATALVGARRFLPFVPAVALAYLAGRAFARFEPSEAALALIACGCVALLLRRDVMRERTLNLLGIAGGVIAGAAVLGKLSAGVFIPLLIAFTTVSLVRPWYRGLAILVGTAVASFLVFWLATGQRPADLVAYATGSLEVIRGYSEAMGADRTFAAYAYIVLYFANAAIIAVLVMRSSVPADRNRRLGLAIVGAIALFAFYKIAVVRWGLNYAFAAQLLAVVTVVRPPIPRAQFLLAFVLVFVGLVPLSVAAAARFVSPVESVSSLVAEARIVARPWRWDAAEAATAEQLRTRYPVDPEIIAAIGDHSVHMDPWQAGVAAGWPDLVWRPLPVFQTYSAYTPALDELDAALLRGSDAPERILRRAPAASTPPGSGPSAIDTRYGWYEAPAAMVQTFCRYDELAASSGWEVLGLTDRRCGAAEPLATITAQSGETVRIPTEPRPDRIVIVRISGLRTGIDAVVTALFKAAEWYVTLDGGGAYRLVVPTAGDGLLLAVPASIVRSPAFSFGPPRTTISVARRGAEPSPVTYEFSSIPLLAP